MVSSSEDSAEWRAFYVQEFPRMSGEYARGLVGYMDGERLGDNPYDQHLEKERFDDFAAGWHEGSRIEARSSYLENIGKPAND